MFSRAGKWNFHIWKRAHHLLSTVRVGNTSMYRAQVTILKKPPPSTVATLDYLGVISFFYIHWSSHCLVKIVAG